MAAIAGGAVLTELRGWEVAGWMLIAVGITLAVLAILVFVITCAEVARKRKRSLVILEEKLCCYWWQSTHQVRVSVPMDISSDADEFHLDCRVAFGNEDVRLKMASSRLNQSPMLGGRYVPEFVGHTTVAPEASDAVVMFKIRASDGVSKRCVRRVPIQVIQQ